MLTVLVFAFSDYASALQQEVFMNQMPARLSLVTLAVTNLKEMSAFYDKLGWPRSQRSNDRYVAYKTGGAILALWPKENFEKGGLVKDFHKFNGVMLAINVESPELVDVSIEMAKRAGAPEVNEAKDASWGGRSGGFKDPEGNVWEITWAKGTSFDDRGGLIYP